MVPPRQASSHAQHVAGYLQPIRAVVKDHQRPRALRLIYAEKPAGQRGVLVRDLDPLHRRAEEPRGLRPALVITAPRRKQARWIGSSVEEAERGRVMFRRPQPGFARAHWMSLPGRLFRPLPRFGARRVESPERGFGVAIRNALRQCQHLSRVSYAIVRRPQLDPGGEVERRIGEQVPPPGCGSGAWAGLTSGHGSAQCGGGSGAKKPTPGNLSPRTGHFSSAIIPGRLHCICMPLGVQPNSAIMTLPTSS